MLIVGGIGAGISGLLIVLAHDPILIFFLFFIACVFAEFMWVSIYLFVPELYPTTIRAIAGVFLFTVVALAQAIFGLLGSYGIL
jgi:MFS family permease